MAKIISLFNHKGGVSKTTTTFNLGWILAEQGKKVLIVDTDPQCNLTGVCLSLSGNDNFEIFYESKEVDNIRNVLLSVFENQPIPLRPARCYKFPTRDNLYLLPGHIGFSEFDVSMGIAQELTGTLKLAQNIPGAINHLLRVTAEKYEFDYILIDMSPSVSATNANLLMQSDYFVVPCSPDYFCNMAINSLSQVIPEWFRTYENLRTHPVFKDAVYKLPNTTPKFIGTILQRYRPRNGSPAQSFQQWITRINNNVGENLVPVLKQYGMIVEDEKFEKVLRNNKSDSTQSSLDKTYNIINIGDFNSLIAQSQKYNVPVFALSSTQMEQVGNILKNMEKAREDFHSTFIQLANNIQILTEE